MGSCDLGEYADLSPDQARKVLYEVMKTDESFAWKADHALEIGKAYLDVENGHLTRIDREADHWQAIASTDSPDGKVPVGVIVDLGTAYCRRTIEQAEPLILHDVREAGWEDDIAVESYGRYCYHGTSIMIENELYGTLCFVSDNPRPIDFTTDETMFAELIGRMLEHELERRRIETQLENLDQFASVVSHDLRNPLNIAQGRIELERDRNDSEHLSKAASALDRMETIIANVLTLARQGRQIEMLSTVSLSQLATRCWEMVDTGQASVTIETELEFRADTDRIERLFENLFRNAVEHSTDPVTVRVGVTADPTGFYVEDTGPGIEATDYDRIFTSGYTTSKDGLGLGLAIVKGIADAHEWDITVTESSEGGARFEFTNVVVHHPERSR
ncbi:sensor histidine kinase [Natronocalculus amylovorans]|uniref:histidine kinase n=1 Tax=Natronocalculus amylovorans TaxID=2917812 RepID=A0AAE3K8M8_9EURY|nr:GAF domain-containing sensor histidine kinase [Natronocalculus amylovorans]MCL9816670.1 GAF domain-containing sensor histidine kinase [Natronocalculus amylovorans]NUE01113.1 GAF domain-containing sensor histidine kinase [Halorubraceae archaeon YAN]